MYNQKEGNRFYMHNGEMKVSVFCLAYNHEKLIRDALDGFVMQKTDFRFEVLICFCVFRFSYSGHSM